MKKKTQQKITKKKKTRKVFKFIRGSILFILLLMLSFSTYFYLSYRQEFSAITKAASDKVASINDNTFREVGPTIIYDDSGKEISKLSASDYIYTKNADIPNLMKYAFVATEDKDFYKNSGISIKGIARAFAAAVKNGGKITQGGSTITQQLVKNVLLTQAVTWQRKITEVLISLKITKIYTKDQILEFYINNINFSNGAYSAASASKIYFGKTLDKLNLAEITFLAAIPNNPTYYNPLTNYDNVITRQHLMLANLKSENYITQQQYEEALNTKVTLNYHAFKSSSDNYITSYAVDCTINALMQQNGFVFKYKFTSDKETKDYKTSYKEMYEDFDTKIRKGGYNIYTSFNLIKQNQLQKSLDNGLSGFTEVDKKTELYKMQGAAVCMDNSTGEVIAAVGGRSQENAVNYFNRAFLAVRQPGSAIKPILVYAPAFDQGGTPDDIITDKYIKDGPKNAENTFFGPVSLRYATELSLNTVAYQMVVKDGIQKSLAYLYSMDFAHISKQDDSAIIGIGGFTNGVTPVEMAGGYGALARGGEFIKPTCVDKVIGDKGELLYKNSKTGTRIYKEESAYNMTDVLKGVLTKSWATGYGLALDNMTAAGKTGTTSDSKDGWFAGYTPYLTTVVWVGYDIPAASSSLYGATYPGHIWQNFMNEASVGLENKDFDVPQSIQDANQAKADAAESQTESSNAESAVAAYENMDIKTKADYNGVSIALQKAQDAVNKVSDSEKQQFFNRINVKTDLLNKEKQLIEAANQKSNTDANTKTNGQIDNSNGTTNTNNQTNNPNGNSTNNTNDNTNNNNTNGTNGTNDSNNSNSGTIVVPDKTQKSGK